MQRTRCCYFYDIATPCNKRDAGDGLLRHRGVQPRSRDPGNERALHRLAPIRHVRRTGRAGGARLRHRTGGRARHPLRRVPPPARRCSAHRDEPASRRDHHGCRPARERLRGTLLVSQSPRPCVVRLRPGFGCRRFGDGRRDDQGSAARAGWRGAQAVARPAGGDAAQRPKCHPGQLPSESRKRCFTMRRVLATTISRSSWRSAPSSAP